MSEPRLAWKMSAGPDSAVLVTAVGAAAGSLAAAAALACAVAEPDRASLLIEPAGGRAPRPSLIATAAARDLEERLAVHLPDAGVASCGPLCRLQLPPRVEAIDGIAAALPLVRGSVAVIHVSPALLQPLLEESRVRAAALLLRADLAEDRALVALAAGDAIARGLRVAVLKRSLGWLVSKRALLGALPPGRSVLPKPIPVRLLAGPS